MTNYKTRVTLIALIMAAVASLFFLVLREVTVLFRIAYGFALLGIAVFWWSGMSLVGNMKNYPWGAAFPVTAWLYLSTQVVFSAVFVLLEQTSLFRLPVAWFLLIHALIGAFFGIRIVLLKGGEEIIERRGEEAREKVWALSSLRADVSAILERTPGMAREIQPVIDALRYSDPMSHASLASYENAVKDSVIQLEQAAAQNEADKIPALCVTLLRQIKDRNNRVKLMK
ncbi:MAG: hypothetical protein LBQ42_08880 [Synergistaceae bacterium]|nr:hypothetical protein [Synergistaceae bacterium]